MPFARSTKSLEDWDGEGTAQFFNIAAPIEKVWNGFVSKAANQTIFMGADFDVDLAWRGDELVGARQGWQADALRDGRGAEGGGTDAARVQVWSSDGQEQHAEAETSITDRSLHHCRDTGV
jgi:hypothetical protein